MFSLNIKGRLHRFETPVVMGIINTTPDSFYTGSRTAQENLLQVAEQMLEQGAAIIDIGGQSTRPSSKRITAEEELARVLPAVEAIHQKFPEAIISIDTFYAAVAREAAAAGAGIVNDISAGTIDENLLPTVAELKLPYVLMHMKGDPQTMQLNPTYNNVVLEVFDFLNFRLKALQRMGIYDVLLDPGLGFGKTAEHNFQLIANLPYLQQMGQPLLIGISRKASIYKTLGTTAEGALNGTTAANTIALMNGAQLLRVHDVKEAVEAIKILEAYKKAKEQL